MMTYDQRMAEVSAWMQEDDSLFQRRDPPKRLQRTDKAEQGRLCTAELHVIAEAMVRAAPNLGLNDFRDLVRSAGRHFELEATTATWPLPKEMAEAIRASASSIAPAPESKVNGSVQFREGAVQFDEVAVVAKRVKARDAVDPRWLQPERRAELLGAGVTEAELAPYGPVPCRPRHPITRGIE